jgi:hypothetical protein
MSDHSIQKRLAARMSAAHHTLAIKTEKAVVVAVQRLGFGASLERLTAVSAIASRMSPLYVDQCVIHGSVCCDMYDHLPGFAYFHLDASRTFNLTPYGHLADARQHALEIWQAQLKCDDEDKDEWDGKFITGSTIVLKDQLGRPIDEFDGKSWSLIEPEERWPELLEQVSTLRSEAHFESGCDNASTAADLRRRADKLERAVQIAELRPRVII